MPIKKTTKLPTVKEKLASLATKRPKAGVFSVKPKSKNAIETKKVEPTKAVPFDWYGLAKRRFSVAQKRNTPSKFSTEQFKRIIPTKDRIID